jgi:predicted aspartyl protease
MARLGFLTLAVACVIGGYWIRRTTPFTESTETAPAWPAAPVQTATATIEEPLASFPMGPERMPFGILSFGGVDYRCILDTGAQHTALNEPHRSVLGDAVRVERGFQIYRLPLASVGSLQIGAGLEVVCHDLDDFARAFGGPVDGVIGMDILSRVTLSLNYDEGRVTLDSPRHAAGATATPTTMRCLPLPFITADVCGEECACLVDTGNTQEAVLRKDLVDRLLERDLAVINADQTTVMMGRIETNSSGLFAYLAVDGFRHADVLFDQVGGTRWEANVGRCYLARYNATLQFANNTLLLTKSKWHNASWWPILRGMTLADFGDRRVVFAVLNGSPAFRAGIRPDHEIDLPPDYLKSLTLWESRTALPLKTRSSPANEFAEVQVEPDDLASLPQTAASE